MSDQLKIVHLSDPHFGTLNPGVESGLIHSIESIAPSLILLTGDITQRARAWQFKEAKEFIMKLSTIPIICIPGNHDIPLFNITARLFYPYLGFQNILKGSLNKQVLYGSVEVLALNSTSRWRHIQGDLNLKKLKKMILPKPEGVNIRIVALHHPMDCARGVDEKNLLKRREQVAEIFNEAEIDLVLSGHIHDPFVSLSHRRYPSLSRNMILEIAGTCLSWRTRSGAPNSYNLIEVTSDTRPSISVTRYDVDHNNRFSPVNIHHFYRENQQVGWAPSQSVYTGLKFKQMSVQTL